MEKTKMDDGSEAKLRSIERAWAPALDEFVQLFIDTHREPTDNQLDAIGAILGNSHNEVRSYIAKKAAHQGSTLLAGHLRPQ